MEPNIRCGGSLDEYPKVRGEIKLPGWYANFRSLLNDPNTSSPANVEASNLYKDNRREYTKKVRESVEKSWED
jgi:ubiquitin-protein ligase